ncbi:MAG TPA: efflux RND transporter permease subunit [Candidatus Saccharimonadales bacterium]|nr:efflux RND transporter permease subunit [Candidatus Saccharimonadales bacterium]
MASAKDLLRETFKRLHSNEADGHWLTRNAKPTIFVIVALTCLGAFLAFSVPISVFPTTNFPRIIIGVENGVMPIEQMQIAVTRPIEEAVNSVPGLQSVRSTTSRGSAEVNLFFDWNSNMFQTLQYVNAALSRVQSTLPTTAQITSNRLTFATFPIMGYSITSESISQTQLWELATYELKPRLNRLEGVSTVIVQGGEEPEFHIIPDPTKLATSSVTVTDLLDAVRRSNLIDSPGLFPSNHQLVLGLVSGQVQNPEQLSQVVVKTTPAGVPIRVADVAQVVAGVKPVYTIVTANGKPAVLLNINRQPESNTMRVATEVHQTIEELRKTLPAGVKLEPFYDQSLIVGESIQSVRDAILIGILLASIIMVLFLGDWGTSIVAALVIPVTILITVIALKLIGQSFNLMTLGGLAAAVGLVIDDAIVVVENIVLHRDAGQTRTEAISSALREITIPLIGSTVTPVVVFLPLVTISGVTGTFFRALAVTVAVSLFVSLALALTWTPTLSHLLIADRQKGLAGEPEVVNGNEGELSQRLLQAEEKSLEGRFGRIIGWYEKSLLLALRRPLWLLAGSLLLIVASVLCYRFIGSDMLPEMDEGALVVDYLTPPGSSLEETNRIVSRLEQIMLAMPEVEGTSRRTGLQLGLAAVTEANRGDISVKLKSKRSRGVEEIIADARAQITKSEPAVDVEFIQSLQDMIGDLTGAPEPIEIKLFARDPELLRRWAPKVAEAIQKVPGVVDLKDGIESTTSGPATTFQVNPMIAARSGFTPEEIATDAAAILEGEPAATPLVSNDRAYIIRVRYPKENRASLETMSNTLINSASGKTATLGGVSTITQVSGQTEIRRENLQRNVAVTARLEGRDMGSGVRDVQKAVTALNLPSTIRVVYGGTFEQQQQSFRDLLLVLALAIVLVFVVLLFEFRTFAAPVSILASALLSTSGVFFALLITRTAFNIASFMGLIMVVGIVAKNGILLLDADQRFRKMGMDAKDAMVQAGRRRLRPIVMTALAAIAGMLPLSLALGAGSQMLQPLAIAVIGGILISMILSLIITPTIHYLATRSQQ